MNKAFFDTLPKLTTVPKERADIAWLIYDLELITINGQQKYKLTKSDEIFTEFESSLRAITTPVPGNMVDFIKLLQERLDEHLETPPTNKTIERPF